MSNAPLPYGWSKEVDRSGNTFYVDTLATPTRSIWVHPLEDEQYLREHPGVREKADHDKASSQDDKSGHDQCSKHDSSDGEPPLPFGWIKEFDPVTGAPFYVDTGSVPPYTTWVHPFEDKQFLQGNSNYGERIGHSLKPSEDYGSHGSGGKYKPPKGSPNALGKVVDGIFAVRDARADLHDGHRRIHRSLHNQHRQMRQSLIRNLVS